MHVHSHHYHSDGPHMNHTKPLVIKYLGVKAMTSQDMGDALRSVCQSEISASTFLCANYFCRTFTWLSRYNAMMMVILTKELAATSTSQGGEILELEMWQCCNFCLYNTCALHYNFMRPMKSWASCKHMTFILQLENF